MTTEISGLIGNGELVGMDSDVTHVIAILDRSGSMQGKESDVIGGFNAFVEGLKEGAGEVGVSYVQFDGVVELVWNDVALERLPLMTAEHYQPRGNTALLDAVGTTVAAIQDNPAHRYIVNIHTDGMENASREWTHEKVKQLIDARTALGNWTFSFFGCEIEAWGDASRMGVSAGNVARYATADTREMWRGSSRASNLMRKSRQRASAHYSAAAAAARDGASDEKVERILRDGDGASS